MRTGGQFNGVVVNCHTHNEYLDQPRYWPSWRRPKRSTRRCMSEAQREQIAYENAARIFRITAPH